MPSVETMVWLLTGVLGIVSILGGVIWGMIRSEAKDQSDALKTKAEKTQLADMEERFQADLVAVRIDSEKLVNKLEARHDKEMEQLATRLGEQIRNTENNILTQIRLMIQVLQTNQSNSNHP